MRYDPLRPHWRETVAEYRAACRYGRAEPASYVMRWADGWTAAIGFWCDGRFPVGDQTARGRRLCLGLRAGWHPDPTAGLLVEYAREMMDAESRQWEREADGETLAEALRLFPLLSAPIWHRAPHAIYTPPTVPATARRILA